MVSPMLIVVANLDVYARNEFDPKINRNDGLLGITLDPNFTTNQNLYIYYSLTSSPVNRLSRFKVTNDLIDLNSEKMILEVPSDRQICCHSAGSLTFGPGGNLFLATGDNTSIYGSDNNYGPIDNRPDSSHFDAQRTAANKFDLRGKILKIHPDDNAINGRYAIPEGNLFPVDGSGGLPEVYIMGNKNPFRIAVDPERNWLFWGGCGARCAGRSS